MQSNIIRNLGALHVQKDEYNATNFAVQSTSLTVELHCTPALAQVNLPTKFLVEFHFAITGLFVAAPELGCYTIRLCLKLTSSYPESTHCGSGDQLKTRWEVQHPKLRADFDNTAGKAWLTALDLEHGC